MVALPVVPAKQFALVCAPMVVARTAAGCVMVTVRVVLQPLLSVTVHVQDPAVSPVAVEVVWAGVVFHA